MVNEPPRATRQAYSVEEAAELLGIGRTTAYQAVWRGELPHIRIGTRILVPRAALDRLLAGDSPRWEPQGRLMSDRD